MSAVRCFSCIIPPLKNWSDGCMAWWAWSIDPFSHCAPATPWFHRACLCYLACPKLFCSVLHTTSYPTRNISAAERNASLEVASSLRSRLFRNFFYCGWMGCVVRSFSYLSLFWGVCSQKILSRHQVFYSENWLDELCRSTVWLPVRLNLLTQLWDAAGVCCSAASGNKSIV